MSHRPHCPKFKGIIVTGKELLNFIGKEKGDIRDDFIKFGGDMKSMSYTKEEDLGKLRYNSFDSEYYALGIMTGENKWIEEMDEEWELSDEEKIIISKEINKQLFELKGINISIPVELIKEYMHTLRN